MAREAGSRMSSLLPSFGGDRSRSKSPGPSRLSKSREPSPKPHARAASQELRSAKSSHNLGAASQDPDARGRPSRLSSLITDDASGGTPLGDDVLMPPPPIAGFGDRGSSPGGSRPQSSAGSIPGSRPASPGGDWLRPATPSDGKLTKRSSWLPGSKIHSQNTSGTAPAHTGPNWAFVVGPQGKTPYDTTPLVQSKPVPEIWDEQGNMCVHFGDKASGQGAVFKLHASMIANSRKLTGQASDHSADGIGSHMRQMSLSAPHVPGSRPISQAMSRSSSGGSESGVNTSIIEEEDGELHLYLQLTNLKNEKGDMTADGLETLLRIRNLFAFLVGQVLVGTPFMPSLFAIFMSIGGTLRRYEFTNIDASGLGEAPTASFLGYVEDLKLGDVRHSREKTMEAIVLGERMKCWPLYNEGYVHAVGKWNELVRLKTPVFQYISETSKVRLEKSSRDLQTRLQPVRMRIETFEFPSLFHGVLASSAASKVIDAKAWKASFVSMRRHVISVYRSRYGQWPPRAKSKKNDFETSGMNRIVAQEVYRDFCDLYNLLVDRTNLTPRSVDVTAHEEEALSGDPGIQFLRKFMSEYDRSSPPVLPPVPYDLPLLPNLGDVRRGFKALNLRKQVKERSKRVKDDDVNHALMQAYNRESIKVTPFLESFMAFERHSARGKTFDEIIDLRIGQWIFLYVVIQSLPMLAIDAPGLVWTQGVEYYLCEVPKGSPPWAQDEVSQKKALYRVAGGSGVVSLPADVVDHSVEGIYYRSHCWQAANEWSPGPGVQPSNSVSYPDQMLSSPTDDQSHPPALGGDEVRHLASPMGNTRRTSMALGLEALPMPPPIAADEKSGRRLSTPDPTKSFDAILGTQEVKGKKKR